MFNPRLIRSALWLAGAGTSLGGLLLWAGGPGKVTPVSALVVVAWLLAVNDVVAIRSISLRWLLQTSWLFGVLVGTSLGARYVLDAAMPTANPALRSSLMSEAVVVVLMAAGTWGGWRSCSARVGGLVAMAGSVIGSTISLAIYIFLFLTTILRNDPDPGEALVVPAILMAVAAVVGTVGGMLGKGAAGVLVGRSPIVGAR
jgi:hypothetical protein